MGRMKISPKIKTLIAVYKFMGLQELIRLEKTYGKFDGVIIYAQNLNLEKMLEYMKEHSFINGVYREEL
jgi:hypothetical protein